MPRLKATDILLTGLLGSGLASSAWCCGPGSTAAGKASSRLHRRGRRMGGHLAASAPPPCRRVARRSTKPATRRSSSRRNWRKRRPTRSGRRSATSLAAARRTAVDAEMPASWRFGSRSRSRARHAEAIIYSISDAVVVTDPSDDVVLANESAARRRFTSTSTPQRTRPSVKLVRDPKLLELIREMRRSAASTAAARSSSTSSRAAIRRDVQGHALPRRRQPDPTPGRAAGVVAVLARRHQRARGREAEERFRLQRQPRAAHAAGEHQGVRRAAHRRRSARRADEARVLRGHPERGQPPRPVDRQRPEPVEDRVRPR